MHDERGEERPGVAGILTDMGVDLVGLKNLHGYSLAGSGRRRDFGHGFAGGLPPLGC
jgi:hypothetical protein